MRARPDSARIEGTETEVAYGIPGEDRDGLAVAELDAAFRWAGGAVDDKDVLVVGAGQGHGAGRLLEAGARSVLGVDPDERAVEIATRLYGERARFVAAEAMALPLASGSFDVVTCFDALDDALDPDAAIAEFRRVLTDNGLLLLSLPLPGPASAAVQAPRRGERDWRELLGSSFAGVRVYRSRVSLAATIAPEEAGATPEIGRAAWLAGDAAEDRTVLALAGPAELPELPSVASLVSFRDLRAQQETLAAWELRARQAEADGSAKHWELVASREAQRRLRMRLHTVEHRPLRILSRILRGKPAKLGEGPPIRASELKPQRWD